MQVNNVHHWAIILFSIAILFFLGCENNLLTEPDNQGLEDWSNSSLDKQSSNLIMPIALARADNPRDFIPDLLGEIVTVQGVITSPNYAASAGTWHLIQDNSAAMQLFGEIAISLPVLEIGDKVVVTGVILQYHGSTYINIESASDLQIVSRGTHMVPKLLNPRKTHAARLADQVGEKIEGQLVELQNVSIVDGDQFPPQGENGLIKVVDSKGDTATVWIDKDFDIDGNPTPSGLINLTGVVIQFTDDTPPDNEYWLALRGLFDIDQ